MINALRTGWSLSNITGLSACLAWTTVYEFKRVDSHDDLCHVRNVNVNIRALHHWKPDQKVQKVTMPQECIAGAGSLLIGYNLDIAIAELSPRAAL